MCGRAHRLLDEDVQREVCAQHRVAAPRCVEFGELRVAALGVDEKRARDGTAPAAYECS
jgi:hypothetical protein